ncbi:MAG: sodium/dicarboxylate or sulfate cotransporter [Candidatus Binatia bacterium]|nr:MAG: sodium/dicarboxylate or sulfate cotransporter [Candidatus Binatia bacterium]
MKPAHPESAPSVRLPRFVVDTRPLWRILLPVAGYWSLWAFAAMLLWWSVTATPPEGLTAAGQRALAIFSVCVLFWVLNVLPLMITSLLAIVLIPLAGVLTPSQAYGLFGNDALFFILGAFILAACLMKSGLSTRIALAILDRFGHTPRGLLCSVLLLNVVMAFFMSEHAVAAMNFPIIAEMTKVLRLPGRRSQYGKALFLAMAWGSTIGGVATLLGGARAPLAIGILRETTGKSFSFFEWSAAIFPLVVVLTGIAYALLVWFFPIDIESVQAADEVLHEKRLRLGRMRYQERAVGMVMLGTLGAWVFLGEEFGLASVAISAVVVLFSLQLVRWSEIEGYVNWGVLLMYGGAICLGSALNRTGAASWVAHATVSEWASNGTAVILVLSAVSLLLTEAMSNAAVVAMLLPMSLGIAGEFGLDPRVLTLTVAVPAGLATTLPIGTPANAIAYSSGYLSLRDLVVPGALLAFCAWVCFNLMAAIYWPWLGLNIGGGG